MTGGREAPGEPASSGTGVISAGDDFATLFRNSISAGMSKILGVDGTQAILFYLNLPNFDDPKTFHDRLTKIFGAGTDALERVILDQLHGALGFTPTPSKVDDFVKQVALAKRSFDGLRQNRRRL